MLNSLTRVSLRDQALDALRTAIIDGSIPPGAHLNEAELAARLSISRGTLREALGVIEREGLAVKSRRGRLQVPNLDAKAIRELFEVREALEILAARSVVRGARPDEAADLLEHRIVAMERSLDGALTERIDADLEFHRTLCTLSGSVVLLETWNALAGRLSMSMVYAGRQRARINMAPERHRPIVAALRSGDFEALAETLHTHLAEASASLSGNANSR